MASGIDLIPPVLTIVTVSSMELFFPTKQVDREIKRYESKINDRKVSKQLQESVKQIALGWQVIVDLIYTFSASLGLLICRSFENGVQAQKPVFWVLVAHICLCPALAVICIKKELGELDAVEIPLPGNKWATFRTICFYAIILSNILLIAAVLVEMRWFS